MLVAFLLFDPALSKFTRYTFWVPFFDGLGIPLAAIVVPVVGAIQVASVAMLLLGLGGRVAATALLPIMTVATITTGLGVEKVVILAGCLMITVLGTGSYSLWRPVDRFLGT